MDVMTLTARLGLDSSEYEKGLAKAEGGMQSLGGTIKKVLGALAIGGAIKSTFGAVVNLTKSAVAEFGEYQQLLGGAQLVYGEAYDFIADKAENAYKTVQMSQSEYLAQANTLGTALKMSLNGDAQAAAELADRVITAEADVVAAMGISQESVQNAFNGLMRGNYMMLDNLGIGIKGTKAGMEEVIQKVNEWNTANGKATQYHIGNLADEQSALIDYIEMVGLAGYANAEAMDTLTGSFASVRGAWKNLLVAFGAGKDIKKSVKNFVQIAKSYAQNIIPVVQQVLNGIGEFVGEIGPVIIAELPGMISSLLPGLLSATGKLVGALVKALPGMLTGIGRAINVSFRQLGKWLYQQSPALGQAFTNIRIAFLLAFQKISEFWESKAKPVLNDVWSYITDTVVPMVEEAWPKVKEAIVGAFEYVKSGWETTLRPALEALWTFITETIAPAVAETWPIIKEIVVGAFQAISDFWTTTLQPALESLWTWLTTNLEPAFTTLVGAINGDETALSTLKDVITQIAPVVIGVVVAFVAFKAALGIGTLIDTVKNSISGLSTVLSFLSAHPIALVVAAIAGLVAWFITAYNTNDKFREKVNTAWNAIKRVAETVWTAVTSAVESVVEAVQAFWDKCVEAKDQVVAAWDTLKTNVNAAIQSVKSKVDGVKNAITNFYNKCVEVKNKIGEVFNGIRDAAMKPIQAIIDKVQGAVDAVKDLLGMGTPEPTGRTGGGGGSRGGGAGRFDSFAKGMTGGYILNRATVFGINDKGQRMVAGEAGPEAVVGVRSLDSMIQSSVNQAMAGVLSRLDSIISQNRQSLQVVLDSGVLVGAIAPQMDNELNTLASWRGGRRA